MKLLATLILTTVGAWTVFEDDSAPTDAPLAPQLKVEHEAVEQAVRDYVDALYLVQPERLDSSVDPELAKYGFWRNPEGEYQRFDMTREELKELASSWNADGHVGENAPKEIVVFEVLDKIAAAKLVADWGIDYFHLVKVDDRWQITQIVWQSAPTED